ncbi:ABC-F family ATP-binding cassette domain-containing protein [Bradyrhizobium sp. BR 10289]|uniref:ABC-F family ATP-binding cassette domain-containing protein n=1 Tax=Bradyrhizobium sp. BR 10289 TaxID=2749993 RepID=UPI001C64E6AF|nr:ABC-F family ATP-binding cassette domain-containing protein [Bradyrhizobium sp. BR 10289]MBW7969142.1 ABC-F family ATP-binding cassette domain-containing protein [Bradyrhizobium sp. BR 10289]
MPASIILSNLSLSTPEDRPLLSNIDLTFAAERTGLVGRNGVGKTTLLASICREHVPQAGRVLINGTIGLLRQNVQLRAGATVADLFGVREALKLLRRAERGDASAEDIAVIDWTLEARLASALARVGFDLAPDTELSCLSGGQTTRVRLAALVFAEPDFLLLDEPTNNLDQDGRKAVVDLLAGWRGGAVVVSHDRDLLETMDAIVELTSLGARRYGGNWSAYRTQKAVELAAVRHDLARAEKQLSEIDSKAQEAAERKARKDSGGRKKSAKADMPRILAGARRDRTEDSGGKTAQIAARRRSGAIDALDTARRRLEILQPLSVKLPSTNLPAGREVVWLDRVSAGYSPERAILRDLSLAIVGPERVAIVGPNGSGKTTLLKLIAGEMCPLAGNVRVRPDFALFDQKVSLLDPAISILDNFRRLNPKAGTNECHAALARFMFRADAALQIVGTLSGGQLLRAGLSCVFGGTTPPSLLILDEPTNHLDIESIEAVEAGLTAYDGALLVVSHDEAFLKAVGIARRVELTASSAL